MTSSVSGNPEPQRRRLRWRTVALMLLVLLIVAGLVYLAVDYERSTSAADAQTCTMPDGTLLTLEKVTFGKKHQFEAQRSSSGFWPFGSPANLRTCTAETPADAIVFWFTRHDATTGKPLDFDWWSHCLAVDEHGWGRPDDNAGLDAMGKGGKASATGLRPFTPLALGGGAKPDAIVAHSGMAPFRHRERSFTLRVYNRGGALVAEFGVADPNPQWDQYPSWDAEALPATRKDGPVTVTLHKVVGRKSQIAGSARLDAMHVDAVVSVAVDGKPAPTWSRRNVQILDVAGKRYETWNCLHSPYDPAWKLQVRVFRDQDGDFDSAEQWRVIGLAAPSPRSVHTHRQSQQLGGAVVELLATGGAGEVSHFGVVNFSGSSNYSGKLGGSKDPFACRIATKAGGGGSTTTVECSRPHVLARVTGLTEAHSRPDLLVTDERGAAVKVHGPVVHAEQTYFWFLENPDPAQRLDLTFLIHRGRTFEFYVAPPSLVK